LHKKNTGFDFFLELFVMPYRYGGKHGRFVRLKYLENDYKM